MSRADVASHELVLHSVPRRHWPNGARMTKRGLVAEECAEDGRGAFVVITAAGRKTIEAAASHHVATVRRLVIDPLGPDDLATLGRISGRILQNLDNATP